MVRIGTTVHVAVSARRKGVVNCVPALVYAVREDGGLRLWVASEGGGSLRYMGHGAVGEVGTWHQMEGCEA